METVEELKSKAYSLLEVKEYKRAIELFYKILTIQSSDEGVLFDIANTFSKMNNFERSKDFYLKILENNPSSSIALKGLAVLYKKNKSYDESLDVVSKLIDIDNSVDNVEFKAYLLIKLDKNEEALQLLLGIYDNSDSVSLINSIALCYLNLGNYTKSFEFYKMSLSIDNNITAKMGLSKVYMNTDILKAQDILNEILENDCSNIKAHYLLAEVFYLNGRYEKAIAQYNLILSIKKDDLRALNKLGLTYSEIGWHNQAIEVYQEILELCPYDIEIRYALAYSYFINNDSDMALKTALKNKTHVKSMLLVAKVEFNQKKYSKAIKLLEDVIAIESENIEAIIMLANSYDEIELKDLAMKNFELSLKLGSTDIHSKYKYAAFLVDKDEYDKAYSILQEIACEEEIHIDAHLLYAEVLIKMKEYEKALLILNKLIEFNKNIVEIYPLGAQASLALDNTALARDFLYESIKKMPSNPKGYYLTGVFMEKLGEPDEAETFYEEAVSLESSNVLYVNKLADFYFQHNEFESALKLYKKSIALNFDFNIEIQILNCYVELNQTNKLKKHLKKAKSKKLDALFMIHK